MKRKITIATLNILLSASVLFTMMSPLITIALDIYCEDRDKITSRLFIFGAIMSFAFATILFLIHVFWKEKQRRNNYEKEN